MHPGGENPGGASLGGLLVRAIPSQEIPREAGEALEGELLVRVIPLQEIPSSAWEALPGGGDCWSGRSPRKRSPEELGEGGVSGKSHCSHSLQPSCECVSG